MYRESNTVRLRFRHVAKGLVAGNMEPLSGFEIAGRDRVFHPAEARIEGAEVVVTSPVVSEPVAVRYGVGRQSEIAISTTRRDFRRRRSEPTTGPQSPKGGSDPRGRSPCSV